jgi:F420-0:gamma-glutamyl ligase
MNALGIRAVGTRVFHAGESLAEFVDTHIPREAIQERMIVAVTSKIVSLSENRLVPRAGIDKATLVKREADVFLGEVAYGCFLTIKEGLFIPSSGIDESNSEGGDFILYPENPFDSARSLWQQLRMRWGLREFGVLLTDSHTSPLRQGVTGVCLSYWGFRATRDMIGTQDLFGRELRMTKVNIADALAAAAVLLMGEGRECRPLAVISGADCEFCEETIPSELKMPLKEDLYFPIFQKFL